MLIFIFFLTIALVSITVFALASRESRLTPLLSLVGIVYVRGFEHLGPDVELDNDSHRYFLSAESVLRTHHLTAPEQYKLAFSIVGRKVDLFVYPIKTAFISEITGIQGANLRIVVPLLMSIVLFYIAWSISRLYLPSGTAVSVTYVYMMMDSIIRHHTIYHQQAVGMIFVLFFLYLILCDHSSSKIKRLYLFPALLLPLTHSVSKFYILFPLVLLLLMMLVSKTIGWDLTGFEKSTTTRDITMITCVFSILVLFFFTYAWTYTLPGIFNKLIDVSVNIYNNPALKLFEPEAGLTGYNIQRHPTILDRSTLVSKVLISIAAVPGLFLAIRSDRSLRQIYAMGIFIGLFGIISTLTFHPAGLGRITQIGYLFALIGAAAGIHHYWSYIINADISDKRIINIIFVLLVVLLLIGNSAARVETSRIEYSSNISADEYHNIDPVGSQLPMSGYWVRSYTPSNSIVYTITATRPAGYYWGLRQTEGFASQSGDGYEINDLARFPDLTKDSRDRLYSNGRIVITYRHSELERI